MGKCIKKSIKNGWGQGKIQKGTGHFSIGDVAKLKNATSPIENLTKLQKTGIESCVVYDVKSSIRSSQFSKERR